MLYRIEIDGLRAIAVVSVILFHVFPDYITGGYIGVDIFFVISGYLITNLINKELNSTNTFIFKNFYARRAKRLIPSLLFTIIISLVFGWLILSPQHLQKLGGSVVYASLSLANLYFYNESGYFDQDSYTKPLLHTWSLSIEEQFYLLFPLILFLSFRQNIINKQTMVKLCLFILFIISFSLNIFNQHETYLIFYLIPFRIFEFVIGSSILFIDKINIRSQFLIELILTFSLMTIFSLLFLFDKNTLFPTYNALVPCLSTAIIIYVSKYNSFISNKILKNYYLVRIGLESYSLYLIHWPIIIYYKYMANNTLSLLDAFIIIFSTFLFGHLLHISIERPIRNIPFSKSFTITKFGVTIISSLLIFTYIGNIFWQGELLKDNNSAKLQAFRSLEDFGKFNDFAGSNLEREFSNSSKLKLVVIGDSQAKDVINIIKQHQMYKSIELLYIYTSAKCQPIFRIPQETYMENIFEGNKEACIRGYKNLSSSDKIKIIKNADIIILAAQWKMWSSVLINQILKNFSLVNPQSKLYIIGPKMLDADPLYSYHRKGKLLKLYPDKEKFEIENYLSKNLKCNKQISYFSFYDLLCNDLKNRQCKILTPENNLIMYDSSHLTIEGATYLSNYFNFLFR